MEIANGGPNYTHTRKPYRRLRSLWRHLQQFPLFYDRSRPVEQDERPMLKRNNSLRRLHHNHKRRSKNLRPRRRKKTKLAKRPKEILIPQLRIIGPNNKLLAKWDMTATKDRQTKVYQIRARKKLIIEIKRVIMRIGDWEADCILERGCPIPHKIVKGETLSFFNLPVWRLR